MVSPYDWSYPGGVRSHIVSLIRSLRTKGIDVEVIAPASKPEDDIFCAGRPVPIPANGSIARVCLSPVAYLRVRQRLEEGDLDLIHVHEPAAPSISLLSLLGPDIPTVATFHAGAPSSLGYQIFGPFLKRILGRIDERIVVSNAAEALVSRYMTGEYHVVPNGIDYSRFRDGEPESGLLSLKPFVLFLGRPEKRKGFEVMLEAMKVVRRDHDVRLVVAGAKPPELPDWAVALGPVGYERLPGIYTAADVYCAPSLGRESFGIVLIEAMASGAPVVCSDIDGYREAAGDAAVKTRPNARDIGAAISRVLSDRSIAEDLSRKGVERAASFDWDVLLEKVTARYEAAL